MSFRILRTGFIRTCALGASLTVLGGCLALPTTNKRAGEKLVLTVHERETPLDLTKIGSQKQMASRGAFVLLPLVAKAVPIAVDRVKKLIEQEQKKYTADYKLGKNNLYFYAAPSPNTMLDPRGIRFQGLEIKRTARTPTAPDDLALRLRLDMKEDDASLYNLLNNSLFQLQLTDLELHYAKAKIPAARWFMPWTLIYRPQDKLNLDVSVKLLGSWIGDDAVVHTNQVLGTTLLSLRDVPINDPAALRTYEQQQRGKTLDGYFYLVPRSAGSYVAPTPTGQPDGLTKGYGQGVYSLEVSVVEAGKPHFVNKIILDNTDALDKATPLLLKQLK